MKLVTTSWIVEAVLNDAEVRRRAEGLRFLVRGHTPLAGGDEAPGGAVSGQGNL
jgi:hypothetical protein